MYRVYATEQILSDGSSVYDVNLHDPDWGVEDGGPRFVFNATSQRDMTSLINKIASAIRDHTSDEITRVDYVIKANHAA